MARGSYNVLYFLVQFTLINLKRSCRNPNQIVENKRIILARRKLARKLPSKRLFPYPQNHGLLVLVCIAKSFCSMLMTEASPT